MAVQHGYRPLRPMGLRPPPCRFRRSRPICQRVNTTAPSSSVPRNGVLPVSVAVKLTVLPAPPTPVIITIGNAAGYSTAGISPGENIVIGGVADRDDHRRW